MCVREANDPVRNDHADSKFSWNQSEVAHPLLSENTGQFLALSRERNTFVVANPERFETLCDFLFFIFFWLNLAYKYTEVCICFANHESLREVWTVCLLFLLWFRFLLAGINNAKEKTSHIYWYNGADHV